MLDHLQQLPVGAIFPLIFAAALIGIGLGLLCSGRQR
jgi:hypothetical protein